MRSGHTIALFHVEANVPLSSERLTILVISGTTKGSIFLRMCVGIGYSSQDLVLSADITSLTCFSMRGKNFLNFGASVAPHLNDGMSVKSFLIVMILPSKYSPKLSANSDLVLWSGYLVSS